MTNLQKSVSKWMKAVDQPVPDYPTIPDNLTRILRISLLLEEVLELAEASGIEVSFKSTGEVVSLEDLNYNISGEVDLVEVADALSDIDYVSAGAACSYGLDIEPFHNEVCRSNDSKLIDGHKREDGKWIKGPKYSPAKLGPILEKQMKIKVADENQLKFQF